jgi:hypothetical protein
MTIIEWLASVDWGQVAVTIAIPVAAIIVPTLIAIRLARAERRDAFETSQRERSEVLATSQRERRLEAGASVIVALAPLASLFDLDAPMQGHLWDLRARIAVYRAWIEPGDLSGDWLALRHREGMRLWSEAFALVVQKGGPAGIGYDSLLGLLQPAHEWAASMTELFSGWLSGNVTTEALRADGARIMER